MPRHRNSNANGSSALNRLTSVQAFIGVALLTQQIINRSGDALPGEEAFGITLL